MKKYVYSEAKHVVVGVLISLFRFCPPFVHKNIFFARWGTFFKIFAASLFGLTIYDKCP